MEPHPRNVRHYIVAGKDIFQDWLDDLKDTSGRAAIYKRLDRVEEGLLGDHRYEGKGVWALRIDHGPGYRVYYGEDGRNIILLLCGGDKGTQKRDIHRAQELWAVYRRQK